MLSLRRALHSFQIRSLFLKFISYFVVLLMAVAFLSAYLFGFFYQQSLTEKEIDRANFERSEATKLFTDTLLRNIDTMTVQLANQSAITAGIEKKDSSLLYSAAVQFGNGFQQSYPSSYCVNGLFIYIQQGGIIQVPIPVIGSQSNYKLDSGEIQSLLSAPNKEDHWLVKNRTPGTGTADNDIPAGGSLLILVRPIPLLGTSVEGAIIVVLDPTALFQTPFVQPAGEKLWMILPDGKHAYETRYGTLIPKKDLDKVEVMSSSGDSSLHARVDESLYSFRVTNSSMPAWKYAFGAPIHRMPSLTQGTIGLLLLLVALVAGFKVTVIAKQIQRSMMTVRGILDKKRNEKEGNRAEPYRTTGTAKDEFSYLIGEVHELMEQTEQLSELLLQSEMRSKQSFIHELLTEPSVYADQRLAQFRDFGIPVTAHGFLVIVFRIDDYLQFVGKYSKADQKLLRYFIAKMAEEQFSSHFQAIYSDVKEQDVVVICNLLEKLPIASARSLTLQEVNSVCQHIHSYLQLTVSVGIGDIHSDIGCISESYHQALQALELRIYKGCKSLIPIWHLKKNHHQMIMLLYNERKEIEHECVAAIKDNDHRLMKSCLKKVEKVIKDLDGCPLALIHHTLWELILIMVYHAEHSDRTRQVELEQLQSALQRFETLDEIMTWMEAISDNWITRKQDISNVVRWSAVDHILEYIQANHDKDISLNGIADQLHLDPSYLSRLFKQEVGMNFIDYLVSLRLKRSKMLLLTTEHSIQDISAMVGYQNVASFSRVFKKYENVSPGQFRARNDPKLLDVNEVY